MTTVSSHQGRGKHTGEELRKLPSVERLLEAEGIRSGIGRYSRSLVTQAVQEVVAQARQQVISGADCPSEAEILTRVRQHLSRNWPGFLSPIINGTGVILHTNLGRAPLSRQALESVTSLGGNYRNLELDLLTGKRGGRAHEVERLLCLLTGAEDALVVNNNAAAVLLILVVLANNKQAVVSRGELVQIGGGFRVPEIMEQSGVCLREVGTTNQTFVQDYEQAIDDKTALLLKVHQSNFIMKGFTHSVGLPELRTLGAKYRLPVVYDLGSGALLATEDFGLEHEPTAQESLAEGADLVCFSGDKLLGGPQSGIILGKKLYLGKLRRHPLLRVIRIDKMSAIALEATVKHYLEKEAVARIPVWQMIAASVTELELRAKSVASRLAQTGLKAEVRDGSSMVGGGSLPEQALATKLVAISPSCPVADFALRLRLATPPLLGRVEEEDFLIDMRTVLPPLDDALVEVVREASARLE